MTKPFPVFCRDCKHSESEERSEWNLRCQHPIVNAKDRYALSSTKVGRGSHCGDEREIGWFKPCGQKGKLWEPKERTDGR